MKTIKLLLILMLFPMTVLASETLGGGQVWPDYEVQDIDSCVIWTVLDLASKNAYIDGGYISSLTSLGVDSLHVVNQLQADSAYITVDSVDTQHLVSDVDITSPHFTSTDSLYFYTSNYNFYIRQAAGAAGDRDMGLYFVEEDGAEHIIEFNDGESRYIFDEDIKTNGEFWSTSTFCFDGVYNRIYTTYNVDMIIDPDEGGNAVIELGSVADADTIDVPASCFLRLMSAPIFAEISTPTAIPNYGKLYTKTDNELYFQDGAGNEHVMTRGTSDHAEMGNIYGNDATEALAIANVWYGMYHANINSGEISGFTYTDGTVGAGNITTAQGGLGINIADAAHGLVDGDIICVQSANHSGVDTVTYVDAGNFEITIAYVGDEAGTWQEGSYLEVATAGQYRGIWDACCTQSAANAQTTIITGFVNTVQGTKITALKYLSNANDIAAPGGNALMDLSVGDRLWFGLQSTVAQTITFKVRNVSID